MEQENKNPSKEAPAEEAKATETQASTANADTADTTVEAATETVGTADGQSTAESEAGDLDEKKKSAKKRIRKLEHEVEELQKKVEKAAEEAAAQKEQYLRLYAEYDNYRKRTQKERDGIYTDAFSDALKTLLPIIDNLERAEANAGDAQKLAEGLAIVLRSAKDALGKMGITEIACETFDPNLHNAVFHVEDEQYGEGQIIEVLQKGYIRGDRVIRYAMVKVAN